MKKLAFVTILASLISGSAFADGFVCSVLGEDLTVRIYNPLFVFFFEFMCKIQQMISLWKGIFTGLMESSVQISPK